MGFLTLHDFVPHLWYITRCLTRSHPLVFIYLNDFVPDLWYFTVQVTRSPFLVFLTLNDFIRCQWYFSRPLTSFPACGVSPGLWTRSDQMVKLTLSDSFPING